MILENPGKQCTGKREKMVSGAGFRLEIGRISGELIL
jgi:hypothetical protein